jgi:hypothetical protein
MLTPQLEKFGLADFLCPISGELMKDPVLADDGRN